MLSVVMYIIKVRLGRHCVSHTLVATGGSSAKVDLGALSSLLQQ